MTDREAMLLALDALENHTAIKHPQQMHYRDTAIEALRQALEQPDDAAWARYLKEPMSEKRVHESDTMERECNPHPDAPHGFNRDASHGLGRYVCDCEGWEPPTVSQEPQTMPEKTDDVAQETQPEQEPDPAARNGWVLREVLFDNGEPVGHREPQQEPVAWLDTFTDEAYSNSELDEEAKKDLTPLYTAPPKRERSEHCEWVGLTDEEYASAWAKSKGDVLNRLVPFARAIEAKLRAKNGF